MMGAEGTFFQKICDIRVVAAILHRTKEWTNGSPFLNNIIYDYVGRYSNQIVEELGGASVVDEIVQYKVVRNWENNAAASHLAPVRQSILSYEDLDLLLILYLRVLQQGAVESCGFPEEHAILRSGLVVLNDGQLKSANAVYAHVFDASWVERQLPGITRPV